MPVRSSLGLPDRPSLAPIPSWSLPRLARLGLGLLALVAGCGGPSPGGLDLDAIRQKAIAEGKADPIPESPTTPEARQARADRLLKESRDRAQANPTKGPRKSGGRPSFSGNK
jgi:hypothetical protein